MGEIGRKPQFFDSRRGGNAKKRYFRACLEHKGEECQREGELQDGEDGGAVGVVGLKGGDCKTAGFPLKKHT